MLIGLSFGTALTPRMPNCRTEARRRGRCQHAEEIRHSCMATRGGQEVGLVERTPAPALCGRRNSCSLSRAWESGPSSAFSSDGPESRVKRQSCRFTKRRRRGRQCTHGFVPGTHREAYMCSFKTAGLGLSSIRRQNAATQWLRAHRVCELSPSSGGQWVGLGGDVLVGDAFL